MDKTALADDEIREILKNSKTIAVVGLSDKPERDSNMVARFLKSKGYMVVPVNPNLDEVIGEKCYPSLSAIPFKVDIVDVFRRSEAVPQIADEAVRIGARVLWLQLGVVDAASAKKHEGSIKTIMDRCIKVEYNRLIG